MKQTKKITIEQIHNIFSKYGDLGISVKTPYGYKHIEGCAITAYNSDVYKVKTDNGKVLECSPNHRIKTRNGKFVELVKLKPNQLILTDDGTSGIQSIELLRGKRDLYDIQVADVHQYYSNGILSHNSSIFDSLSFCIFDKSSRAFKAQNILNNRKTEFYCKFHFKIDDVDYFIERLGRKQIKSGTVKVDVNFWRERDGIVESLNGEQRRDTNLIIEQYLGQYEDFVLTTLSLQGNNALFIDKTQSERKDILSQFIGVDIFDKLYNTALDINKEQSSLIKKFKKDDFSSNMSALTSELTTVKNEYKLLDIGLTELRNKDVELTKLVLMKTQELTKIETDVNDVTGLESAKTQYETKLVDIQLQHDNAKSKLETYLSLYNNISNLIAEPVYHNIKARFAEYTELKTLQTEIHHNIDKCNISLASLEQSLAHLDNHEYNPDCAICVKNSDSVIQNKQTIQAQIYSINDDLTPYGIQSAHIQSKLDAELDLEQNWTVYNDLLQKQLRVEREIATTKQLLASISHTELQTKSALEVVSKDIMTYYEYQSTIESNNAINNQITDLTNELRDVKKSIELNQRKLLNVNGNKSTIESKIEALNEKIREVKDLEEQYMLYEYYLDAVKRDGVSYELISKVIPVIEGEINNILSQMVDFGMQLEMDGKNINALLTYDSQQWPLELSSGMERFISGLAIRVALINICNLPRPNFLVVDEGMGALDSDNMASMYLMLNYLKTQFDFIMIISHIDTMRDVVDQLIEIKKDNGFSHLRF
jgi:DNA repair exonuclease SbcCD ATPase subunit